MFEIISECKKSILSSSVKSNIKVAVHCHLFYTSMWAEIRSYLENLSDINYDLFITINEDRKYIISQIKEFNSQARIFIVENRGYDVGPFIYFLHQIDLQNYDFILKIHTKNTNVNSWIKLNHSYFESKDWFRFLIKPLLGSKKQVLKNLQYLSDEKKRIGMIGSKHLITSNNNDSIKVLQQVENVFEKMKIKCPSQICFVAGTMFWIKSSLLNDIKKHFQLSDFLPTNSRIKDGTLAHAMERVFGCLCLSKKYRIVGVEFSFMFLLKSIFYYLCKFAYSQKITKHNYMQIKICKIPVFHKK